MRKSGFSLTVGAVADMGEIAGKILRTYDTITVVGASRDSWPSNAAASA